ncbi:variable surface protein [Plasmodium gonderi]|uniref:Variable surface protein n=1 Tax=Plasmodium gonderi TaxID=77519 RepID=A0A1Y1JRU9_PLAGO|nr:variable surface protein [Plasmodium gonderi]GAW83927.1 variable surface protein [Plasmodium gonderi]
MDKDIYKLAKDFPTWGSIMENAKSSNSDGITGNCNSFEAAKFKNFDHSVQKICKQAENYTSTIESTYWERLNQSKFSCIYLYYWLYYYNNNKNMGHIKSLFHEFLETIDTSHKNICSESAYTTITDDEMQKLKDLHDMYTKLNNIENNTTSFDDKCSCANECAISYMKYKNPCESNSFSDFCNELKNVREKYNALRALRRKRNKWNNIDENYNIFQSYKNESNASMKRRHHIL